MKKIFFFSLLFLIFLYFFTVQNNILNNYASANNSVSLLDSGWVMKLSPNTEHFENVFFANENLGCIYTGTHPVKRTTDGGNTWGYGIVPYLTTTLGGIYFNGTSIYMAGYLSLPGSYYLDLTFRSSNMGQTWDTAANLVTGGPPPNMHYYYYFHNMYKMVGFMGRNYISEPDRTKNGGYSWQTIVMPGNVVPSMISYVDVNYIYGTFSSGIGRCINPAQNFTIIKSGSFSKICVVDSNNILASKDNKLYRTNDAGVTWDSSLIFSTVINSIFFPDQTTGYMTGNSGKIFKSTDKGATWYSQVTPNTDNLVGCWFLNALTGYVIGYNGTLLKTGNGGGTLIPFTVSGSVKYSDNNQNVTSGKVKAFRYENTTGTGNVIVLDSAQIQSDGSYILNNIPQGDLYIGAVPNSTPPSDYVFTYYPSATYWQRATILHINGNQTNINVSVFRMSQGTSSNHIGGKVNSVIPASPLKDANIYVKSVNTFIGFNPSNLNGNYLINNLPTGSIKVIADRMGYRADSITVNLTDKSSLDSVNFYLLKLIIAAINPISNVLPDKYFLYQNYPNPFNPATNIKYQITNTGFVSLKVYDLLGREVSTLVNDNLKPGVYEASFNGNGLPSGIYFYRLITDGFTETKRMVLVK